MYTNEQKDKIRIAIDEAENKIRETCLKCHRVIGCCDDFCMGEDCPYDVCLDECIQNEDDRCKECFNDVYILISELKSEFGLWVHSDESDEDDEDEEYDKYDEYDEDDEDEEEEEDDECTHYHYRRSEIYKPISVVQYKRKYYLLYGTTEMGKAKLLKPDGKKYSGTPGLHTLKYVKHLTNIKTFNGHSYVKTKIGIIGISSGNLITHPKIIKLFEEKVCLICGEKFIDKDLRTTIRNECYILL